jgi:transaldolase
MASKLKQLTKLGQSVWFDDVNRDVLQKGRLAELKQRYAVTGGTSNPTIFERAFADSHAYDDQFRALAARNWEPERILEDLALTDVQLAADLFRKVFNETGGEHGYISLEVSPRLAYDTEATVRSVKHLWASLNRPNVMIKIPGTIEGLPAIETCLEAGINVNITLLFSISNYAEVAQAYMSALEKRLAIGQRIDNIASVASFFVSRVDALADSRLADVRADVMTADEKDEMHRLKGKIAIANAKLAYVRYQDLFGSDRWKALANAGARVQRCLWASTSTKNPDYPDTMYVDNLIGPDTVSTMTEATLLAFEDHGVVEETLTKDVDEAEESLRRFEALGLSLPDLTDELQRDGVAKFSDSYTAALESIKARAGSVGV